MDWVQLIPQIGLGGAIAIIFYLLMKEIVRHFIKSIEAKDAVIVEMTKSFNNTINNHLNHSTRAAERLESTNKEMINVLLELKKEICKSRENGNNQSK